MNPSVEKVTTAAQAAIVLTLAVRAAHSHAQSVIVGDALLDLIGEAAALENKLKRLQYALMEMRGQSEENGDNELLTALQACKAAVENGQLPPSVRLELVRDFATPAIVRTKGGAR
jgi:hypothetical protein